MNVVLEINEKLKRLDEDSQYLVLNVISRFLGESDDADDILTDEDLHDIKIAEEEYVRGEYFLHSQIDWKHKQKT